MFRAPWLHNLFGMAHARKDRRCQATQQQRRVRLMLESLEDRITPSTYFRYDPRVAVGNALVVQRATTNYLHQIFNSATYNAGGQTSISGQNGISDALAAAVAQDLIAISKELSSTSFPNNPVSLMELQLQLQMAQPTTPSSAGISVSPLAN